MALRVFISFYSFVLIFMFMDTGLSYSSGVEYNNSSSTLTSMPPSVHEKSTGYKKLSTNFTMDILDYIDSIQSTTPPTFVTMSNNEEPKEFNISIGPYDIFAMNINVHNDTEFILVQSHSFYNYLEMTIDNFTIKGTNIGAIYFPRDSSIKFSIKNFNRVPVKGLVFVTAYDKNAPVPGAYSPSYEIIMPMPQIHVYPNLIKFSAVASLLVNLNNETIKSDLKYRLFYKYTAERDLSEETFFEGLRSMKSINDMKTYANEYMLPDLNRKVNTTINVTFANYPGTGIVFGLVAETSNGSSVYVLSHTFGCNFTSDINSCFFLVNSYLRVEMVILCVLGLLLCCCGFEWRSFELAVMTFILFSIPTYTALYNFFTLEDNAMISLINGVIISCISVFISCYTKCAHLRHSVSFFTFGMLVSAVVMFSGVGNSGPFKSESVYWITFFANAVSTFLLLYLNRSVAHYFTTGIIGSFIAILTIDYFAGSSFKYIIFDNIRRINVEGFIRANIDPPFQTPDFLLAVFWVILAHLSVIYQCYNRHRRTLRILRTANNNIPHVGTYSSFDETSPLLHPNVAGGFINDY